MDRARRGPGDLRMPVALRLLASAVLLLAAAPSAAASETVCEDRASARVCATFEVGREPFIGADASVVDSGVANTRLDAVVVSVDDDDDWSTTWTSLTLSNGVAGTARFFVVTLEDGRYLLVFPALTYVSGTVGRVYAYGFVDTGPTLVLCAGARAPSSVSGCVAG